MSIKRRKTEEKEVWDLVDGDDVVGQAKAHHKSATQRTWDATVTVDGVTASIEGAFSITRAVAALNDQLAQANTADAGDAADADVKITKAADATA